jgi:hypothetical protein
MLSAPSPATSPNRGLIDSRLLSARAWLLPTQKVTGVGREGNPQPLIQGLDLHQRRVVNVDGPHVGARDQSDCFVEPRIAQ